MKWTQEELEALYKRVNERALKDAAFMEKVKKDTRAALEEMAGCELPDDLGLKYVEKDNQYANTYVTPDFAQGELDLAELRGVAGGVGGAAQSGADLSDKQSSDKDVNYILIVSVCLAALSTGPDVGVCLAAVDTSDLGNTCLAFDSTLVNPPVCPGNFCAADFCAGEFCGADAPVCGAEAPFCEAAAPVQNPWVDCLALATEITDPGIDVGTITNNIGFEIDSSICGVDSGLENVVIADEGGWEIIQ